MRLPKLDDLVDEQMVVYEHDPDQQLFVAGPPGSGKTTLAVLRASFLRDLGKSVVLVTRNKMLAALARQLDNGELETRTMNKFVIDAYRNALGGWPPEIVPYQFDWARIIESFEANGVQPRVDHLIVDEGQNLPAGFFRWAVRFAARTLTVFADEDQTTDPQHSTLRDIFDSGMPAPIRLELNHRNSGEIARVAEHFHRSALLAPGIVKRGSRARQLPRLVQMASWEQLADAITIRFQNQASAIGVIVYRKEEVLNLRGILGQRLPVGTRVDAYVSNGEASPEDIRLLEAGVTILSSESVIGLEFDVVYLQDLHRSLPGRTESQARRLYMLCARARHDLILINGPIPLSPDQLSGLPDAALLAR